MSKKKAKTFDFTQLLGQTIKHAQERSRDTLEKRKHDEIERQTEKATETDEKTTNEIKSDTSKPITKAVEPAHDVGPAIPGRVIKFDKFLIYFPVRTFLQ